MAWAFTRDAPQWARGEVFGRWGFALGIKGWRALEELGGRGQRRLAKLAGLARQCLHLDDER